MTYSNTAVLSGQTTGKIIDQEKMMKKVIGMVLFTGIVLMSPKIMSNIAEGIQESKPTYNSKEINNGIEYYIIDREYQHEIHYEINYNPMLNEPVNINIPPVITTLKSKVEIEKSEPRYKPSANERKLMAALAWREDRTSTESMMAVTEVVLNRLESDMYSFSKLKDVEDVIFQASWIKGNYVEQYVGAKKLYKIDPPDEAFEAVDRVCNGETVIGNKALFHAEESVPSWRIANNIYIIDTVGATNFWGIKEE